MENLKVVRVDSNGILFDNGVLLDSYHSQDCCEHHWLCFDNLTLEDFDGLRFDLSGEDFFKRIEGYGIELIPLNGWSIKIAGYGSNNGYYSSHLDLVLSGNGTHKTFDISECQEWDNY